MNTDRCIRCKHLRENHDLDDGCGACAMRMTGPCRAFIPVPPLTADYDDQPWEFEGYERMWRESGRG